MTPSYYKTKSAGYREIQTRFHKDVTNFPCYLTQFLHLHHVSKKNPSRSNKTKCAPTINRKQKAHP